MGEWSWSIVQNIVAQKLLIMKTWATVKIQQLQTDLGRRQDDQDQDFEQFFGHCILD